MIGTVIFDLDGTLLDTTEGIIKSVRYTIDKLGFPGLPYNDMLSFVGPPIQESFKKHYNCNKEMAQYAADVFRNYYKGEALYLAEPYDGIYDLCKTLKKNGIRIGVATYKREDYARKLLQFYDFDRFYDTMHGADNENVLKKSDIIQGCLNELGIKKTDAVLVGDTINDAIGAKNAGIPFIAVTYGFGFRERADLTNYSYIGVANSPIEVVDIVLSDRRGERL